MISSINLKTVTDFIFYNEKKSPTETSIISWAQFFLNCKSHYLHCRPRLLHFMEYPVRTVYFFTRDIFQGSPQSRYPQCEKIRHILGLLNMTRLKLSLWLKALKKQSFDLSKFSQRPFKVDIYMNMIIDQHSKKISLQYTMSLNNLLFLKLLSETFL